MLEKIVACCRIEVGSLVVIVSIVALLGHGVEFYDSVKFPDNVGT